ncbi:MAG: hypothetical protein GYA43_10960 [Bacteroidales bacterium]|nr:hypothetical protein [Bacteroidales bacterium]
MKILPAILLASLTPCIATGQDIVKLVSGEICSCIDTLKDINDLETKLDSCLNVALENVINLLDEDQQEMMADEQTIDKTVRDVSEKLLLYCPKIRDFVLSEREKTYYRISDSEKANQYYEAGVKAFDAKEYRKAEKYFLKAIKADRAWVYPYDELGLNYRVMGKNKKAIRYYDKSLAIYPEGSYALQNQAIAYTYTKDYDKALRNYNLLAFLYPDNPEGFFGTARVHFLTGNYENALEYAFYAHRMYINLKSDYVKDSEKLISMIRDKLTEQGKSDVYFDTAGKFGFDPREK